MPEIVRWFLILGMSAFALYAGRQAVRGLATGTALSGDVNWPESVTRKERPVLFWLYLTGWVIGALSGAVIGTMLLFAPALWLEIAS